MAAIHGTEWSEASIAMLRALWDEGHSGAEIGRRLDISKNAIIGKARRLGLEARPSPIVVGGNPKKPGIHKRERAKAAAKEFAKGPTVPALPSGDATPVEPEVPGAATGRGCQWVITLKPLLQCGKPVYRNTAWCEEHRNRVYVRTR